MKEQSPIPGYDFGSDALPCSAVSLDELRALERACGCDEESREWLRKAAPIFTQRAEELVDTWRAAIALRPEMSEVFFGPDGQPDDTYKAGVKRRFVQWVIDVCEREHDRNWLDYQEEIGKRHTPAKKNRTEAAQTPPLVPLRYLVGFSAVVSTSIRPMFEEAGYSAAEIQQVQDAWTKSVLLHVALWTRPYVAAFLW